MSRKTEIIGSMMHTIRRRGGRPCKPSVSSYENKRAIANGHAEFAAQHGMPVPDGYAYYGNPKARIKP